MASKTHRPKRPLKTTTRTREVFSVRFSRDELEQLRSEARARGGSIAGTVRNIVLNVISQPRAHTIMLGASTGTRLQARVYGELIAQTETLTAA